MNESIKNLSENLLGEKQAYINEEKKEKNIEMVEEETRREDITPSFSDIYPQIWSGLIANGLSFMGGVNTGFSTVFISKLMSDPNISQFSNREASWIASLSVLSGPLGAMLIGPITDKAGRKRAIMFAGIFHILSWILTYSVNESIWPLYIARIIGGFGGAMTMSVGIYVSEVCHPKVRDVMMLMVGAFVSTGSLATMVLGSYIEWHQASLYFSIISIICLLSTFLMSESPLWLVTFKPSPERLDEALKLVRYFNRSHTLYEAESRYIKEVYAKTREADSEATQKNPMQKWILDNLELFKERNVYKPMIILLMIFFFWAFSGVFVVIMYSANIFKATGGSFNEGFDEYTATIISGVIKLVMTIVSAFISIKVGRRILMIISSLGMSISIISAGIFQSFSNLQLDFSKTNATSNSTSVEFVESNAVNMLTVISLILFILLGSLAMANIPWALICELLPTKARAIGHSLIITYSSILLFIVLKLTPLVVDIISLSVLYFIFGIVSLLSAIYIYFKLPETFGRNFQEIEKYFAKDTPDKI